LLKEATVKQAHALKEAGVKAESEAETAREIAIAKAAEEIAAAKKESDVRGESAKRNGVLAFKRRKKRRLQKSKRKKKRRPREGKAKLTKNGKGMSPGRCERSVLKIRWHA
jgi:hypothetical protein